MSSLPCLVIHEIAGLIDFLAQTSICPVAGGFCGPKAAVMPEFTACPLGCLSQLACVVYNGYRYFLSDSGSGKACGEFQWNIRTPLELDLFVSVVSL